MFDTRAANERSPLIEIASGLAEQCEAAGRFALVAGDWTDEFYLNRIAGHISVVRSLLFVLEQRGPVMIAETDRPFLFWPKLTPGSHPPGGYSKWEPGLDPKTYVESLIAAWLYQLDMKKKHAPHWLALRGALWVTAHHGPSEGIRYLFALARHGWLIEPEAFSEALVLLVRAAGLGGDGETVVSHFFHTPPRTLSEWHDQLMQLSDIVREPSGVCRDESVLETVITEALGLASKTGNAPSYDAWLSLHLILYRVLNGVFRAVDDVCPSPHATLKAVLEQLEEVRADSGAAHTLMKSNLSHTPLIHHFKVMSGLVEVIKAKAGNLWKQRARERPAIPRAILEYFDKRDLDSLPDNWKYASAAIAWPLTTWTRGEVLTTLVRSSSIPYDQVVASPLREPLLTSLLGNDRPPELEDAILRQASTYHSGRPIAFSSRKLAWELSRLLSPDDATVLPDDPVADKVDEWLKANHDAVTDAISSFMLDYSSADIMERVEKVQRIRARDPRGAIDFLRQGTKDYPWCEFLYHELSIACDEDGDLSQAVQSIRTAIFLRPGNYMFWQSLGVILRRQGHELHGNLASAMAEYLSQNQEPVPNS